MNNSFDSSNLKPTIFADCLINSKEIFQLIDNVFPVDSCRHYGVLPLQLTGNDLALGILDPNDEESLKFINSIARVFSYSLELQLLDRQTLQIMLDSYLSSDRSQSSEPDQNKTVIDRSFSPQISSEKRIPSRRLVDSAPTIISQSDELPSQSPTPQSQIPSDFDFLKNLDSNSQPARKPSQPQVDSAATLYEIPPEFRNRQVKNLEDNPTIIEANPAELAKEISNSKPEIAVSEAQTKFRNRQVKNLEDNPTIIEANPAELLALENTTGSESEIAASEAQISALIAEANSILKPGETSYNADFLPGLMPQLSWQKLLEGAFEHQSESIQLNLHRDRGSIVANKNESLQSTVEEVPLPIFCSLIDEIKRMARIPQNTTSHPKKVVIERFYRQERILLRIEFALQQSSGRVNVQILRDRTLRIYEQQQMDKVSQQALQLSQQLEKTLRRIHACFDSAELTNLKELQAVYHKIGHQLRMLDR